MELNKKYILLKYKMRPPILSPNNKNIKIICLSYSNIQSNCEIFILQHLNNT